LALKEERNLARQAAGFREGAAGLDKGHELPLVVADAARDNPLAGRDLDDTRLERRALPQIEGVWRLNIVMAVKEDMRHVGTRGLGLSDNDRMAGGLAHRRLEAEALQLGGEPFGRLGAIARIGGIGRNRGDFN